MCDSVRNRLRDFGISKLIGVVFTAAMLWLGVHTLAIVVEGNRNPSVPMSTPCPVLTTSMMPTQYQLEGIYGYHSRTRVKPAVGSDGQVLPLPPGLDIVVENRCFNGGIGSVYLWVNNELAAFSRIDKEIYDCHGERIFDTTYDTSSLKVNSASGNLIWSSDVPDYGSDLIITGQPENTPAATISSSNKVTIQNSMSAAADPRLIVMMHAVSYFTEKYSSASTRRTGSSRRSRTSSSMRLDGCNGFVFAGGILWLCLIGVALIYAAKVIRDRRLASGTGPAPLVQLSESRVPNSDAEALPDSAPYGAEISKPSESPVAFVPNSEGFTLSCASVSQVNGVYSRQAYATRNGAPIFTQSAQPSVEIILDRSGANPFWAIYFEGRLVYHMHPNPLDPNYNSYPNLHGSWDAADVRPGDYVSVPVMAPAPASSDTSVPMNTLGLVGNSSSV